MASVQTVIVTGANGKTGNFALEMLLAEPEKFHTRALVASEEGAQKLVSKGMPEKDIHIVDVTKGPSAELDAAFSGCDAAIILTGAVPQIVLTSLVKVLWGKVRRQEDAFPDFTWKRGQMPEQVDWEGQKHQIDAAKRAGVKHVILVSSMGYKIPNNPLNKLGNGNILVWKRKAEEYLLASGVPYTIIHPARLVDSKAGDRELVLGVDDTLLAEGSQTKNVPRADVAALAVHCLSLPEAMNRSFDVASKEWKKGVPTTDFKKLLGDLQGNCTY